MIKQIFLPLVAVGSLFLTACSSNGGFGDLDRFMTEIDAKPRGTY